MGAVAAAVACTVSRIARAQTTVYGTGSASISYTDNLYNAPSHPEPGGLERRDAWYLTLQPGLGLAHEAPESSYLLTYSHSFMYYLKGAERLAHGDSAMARGNFELTPVDSLTLSATGARTSTAFMLAEQTSFGQPQPRSSADFLSAGMQQGVRHEFSAEWTGQQTASFNAMTTRGSDLPEPVRFYSTGGLGATYQLERDAWSLDWSVTYFHSRSAERSGLRIPRSRHVQSSLLGAWRHDLSAEWASELHAGVGVGRSFDGEGALRPAPLFGGSLQWHRDVYSATLSYNAQMTPDLYTNRVYYSDGVSLAGSWALLPEQGVTLSSTNGVSANQPLVSPGVRDEPTLYSWASSSSATWSPGGVVQIALTFQHTEQFGTGARDEARRVYRNQVVLSVSGRYPEIDLTPFAERKPFRVDGSDQERPEGAAAERDSHEPMGSGSSGTNGAPDPAREGSMPEGALYR
ncbi:MAG: hypothetical protein JW940_31890 [Polyangiaceae bacterium]|nr:hypothetical protein [Polyangiaceae bacterium]